MQQRDEWSLIERHHSEERTAQYLDAAGRDRHRAADLLRWNCTLSAAMWESLAHVEVALRNTIDRRLTIRGEERGHRQHWVFDGAHEFGRATGPGGRHRRPYLEVLSAMSRVRQNSRDVGPGQVISELPFGFWHQLLSKQQRSIWPDLAAGFPGAPGRAQSTVHDPVARLRSFRNRLAHHHAVWSYDIEGRWIDVLRLAAFIDPELADWIARESRMPRILTGRPALPPR